MVFAQLKRFQMLIGLAVLLALSAVVDGPFLTLYRISGRSMMPSFADGDRVLVSSMGGIHVGDAVIARYEGETLIKRVVARPGDTVELLDGALFRNGAMAEDAAPLAFQDRSELSLRYLGEDEYFLLGDNRRVSVDSRIFGPVKRRNLVGRVVYRWLNHNVAREVVAAEHK